jgi:hypothetical protein
VKASVNLRGDLAKLSDDELAARLEATWQALDAAHARKKRAWFFNLAPQFGLIYPWRGPPRHPRFYRFLAIWSAAEGSLLAAVAAAVFSGRQYERFLRNDPGTDEYLSITEVRDIMDEIERRLALRRSGRMGARRSGA